MAIVTNTVVYLDGDVVLEAFFAFDDEVTGRRPAVLINHTCPHTEQNLIAALSVALGGLSAKQLAGKLGISQFKVQKILDKLLKESKVVKEVNNYVAS